MGWKSRLAFTVLGIETLLLLPIAYSPYLRFDYLQTLARWYAKAIPPDTVFIGDSITAAGMSFNDPRSINLAGNGLQTFQITELLSKALAYSPRHVSVMAGINDAGEGPINVQALQVLWKKICAEPKVVVTLLAPTAQDELNPRVVQINQIIRNECQGRPIIDLQRLAGEDGRIQPKYTIDGVHFSKAAIDIWRAELRKHGI